MRRAPYRLLPTALAAALLFPGSSSRAQDLPTLTAQMNQASAAGQNDLAIRIGRQAPGAARAQGSPPEVLIYFEGNLGLLLVEERRYDEAEPLLREALALGERGTPPHEWWLPSTLSILGRALEGRRRHAEAEGVYRRALDAADRATTPMPAIVAEIQGMLADALRSQGKLAEAEGALRKAIALRERSGGKDDATGRTIPTPLSRIERVLNLN